MDFEKRHLSIIEEYEHSATEIERIFFTERYHFSKKHYALLAVQSIAILYSYWEGYIQKSFQLYIEYINSLRINFDELNDSIVLYYMENQYKQFREYPTKIQGKIKFYNELKKHYTNNIHDIPKGINTESNVGFSVLNKLLEQLALDLFPEYWDKYTYPNSTLKELLNRFIRYRNGVSHGGDISSEEKITQAVYSKYRALVVDLMYEIHNKFMDSINNKRYLKVIGNI